MAAVVGKVVLEQLASQMIAEGYSVAKNVLYEALNSGSFTRSSPEIGSLWITDLTGTWGLQNGKVMSAYYHPTKDHTATTVGKNGQKRSAAAKGTWAVSIQTRAAFGNKAYYNHI